MFQFPGFPSHTYWFSMQSTILHRVCSHIRKSADQSLYAAPRSLSQLVTSFFGSQCQGILHMLLFAWTTFLRCSASFSLAVLAVLFFAFRIAMIILHFTVNSFLFASKNCFFYLLTLRLHCCSRSLEKPDFFKSFSSLYYVCHVYYLLFGFQWTLVFKPLRFA